MCQIYLFIDMKQTRRTATFVGVGLILHMVGSVVRPPPPRRLTLPIDIDYRTAIWTLCLFVYLYNIRIFEHVISMKVC